MRYAKETSVAWRRIADEVVIVPIGRPANRLDSIYVLNEVAARAWELLERGTSISGLASAICEEFEVEPDEAEADLADLLAELEQVGAVTKAAP
ncbi:MAG: PqqD family protein [Deltaproteobacteria bacterium]|nr:PqqD family protein [Deltaproteobacteria bacterium]